MEWTRLGPGYRLRETILAFQGTKAASQRSDSMLRHLGRGRLPQRVTVGGKRGSASHCQLPTFEERQHPHKPTS